MRPFNRNLLATVPFAAALSELGLQHAVISPGSRNTPLSLAFADEVSDWSFHDERSAAFFALGLAKHSGKPVVLICTSGTAAAHYLPALWEARQARLPLLVLTADRPPELRDVGAAQTIRQQGMYGEAVKWSHDFGAPVDEPAFVRHVVSTAAQAWTRAQEAPAGPVHLNFPFRDPLAPTREPVGAHPVPRPARPFLGRVQPSDDQLATLAQRLSGKQVLLLAGPTADPELPQALADLSAVTSLPVIADPLSGLRATGSNLGHVVTTGDPIARRGELGALTPGAVIRFGGPLTSKAWASWLASHTEVTQVVVDDADWRDPTGTADLFLRSHPVTAATMLSKALEPSDSAWPASWAEAEEAIRASWGELPFPSEPAVPQVLSETLTDGAAVWLGSSMPIRDADAFFPLTSGRIRFFGHRGANGIDGLLSSAMGSAAAGSPTYVVAGDIAFLHDLTALAATVRLGLDLTVVLVNNDGGGIFHFLPQSDFPEHFERHLATPHGLEFRPIVEAFGGEYVLAEERETLASVVAKPPSGLTVVEVRTDRRENRALHDRLFDSVHWAGL